MTVLNAEYFIKKPCKFILKNGKVIFGVIWRGTEQEETTYYFSSKGEFMRKKKGKEIKGEEISLDDLIHAEIQN